MFRKEHYRGLLIAMVVIAAGVGYFLHSEDEPDPVTQKTTSIGYYSIVPPTALHLPGTINTVKFTDDGRVMLHPTCEVDREVIMAVAEESPVPQTEMSEYQDARLSIEGIIKSFFTTEGNKSVLKEFSSEIKNPRVLLISDAKLREIKMAALQDKSCGDEVTERIMDGEFVCQTRAAIEGDLEYRVEYKEDISAEVISQVISKISTKFNLVEGENGEFFASGEKMFFAVRLHPKGVFLNKDVVRDSRLSSKHLEAQNCPQADPVDLGSAG